MPIESLQTDPEKLTLEQIRECKKQMEDNIRSAILAELDLFHRQTQLHLDQISLETVTMQRIGQRPWTTMGKVECTVSTGL